MSLHSTFTCVPVVGGGIDLQSPCLGGKHLYLLSHLPGLSPSFYPTMTLPFKGFNNFIKTESQP